MDTLVGDVGGLGEGVDHTQQGVHLQLDRFGGIVPRDVLHGGVLVALNDSPWFALLAPALYVARDKELRCGMVVVGFGEIGQEVFQSLNEWIYLLGLPMGLVGIYYRYLTDRIGLGITLF